VNLVPMANRREDINNVTFSFSITTGATGREGGAGAVGAATNQIKF
jgi:hypothetical protein